MKRVIVITAIAFGAMIRCYGQSGTDIPLLNTDGHIDENSVFVSPVNPDIIFSVNNGRSGHLDCFLSTNGGSSWVSRNINLIDYTDPAVVIDRSGRIVVNYMSPGPESQEYVAYSTDQGATWTEVLVASGDKDFPAASLDKNHLWVDNSLVSPYSGNLYCAWTSFPAAPSELRSHDLQIMTNRSTDGGVGWSGRQVISSGISNAKFHHGVNLQTGPNGEVYACWAIYDVAQDESNETGIGFARSTNGGISWAAAQRIQNITGFRVDRLGGSKTMRAASFPSMSVNQQNGDIYIVWTNRGMPPGEDYEDLDIYCLRSFDNGQTWETAIKVNQNAENDENYDQWFPWISCDPISGAITVAYYDSRDFGNNDSAHTYLSVSYDRGANWQDFRVSDDHWPGDYLTTRSDGALEGYAGDYIANVVRYCQCLPLWSDSRYTASSLHYMNPYTSPLTLGCPQDLDLCKATITEQAMYSVSNRITVGGAGCQYTVAHRTASSGNCKMYAGAEVVLKNGFTAELGSVYHAKIQSCSGFCDQSAFGFSTSQTNTGTAKPRILQPRILDMSGKDGEKEFIVYPNPLQGSAYIRFRLMESANVSMTIENSVGEAAVVVIGNRELSAGLHNEPLDVSRLPQGVYRCRLRVGSTVLVRKIIVIR